MIPYKTNVNFKRKSIFDNKYFVFLCLFGIIFSVSISNLETSIFFSTIILLLGFQSNSRVYLNKYEILSIVIILFLFFYSLILTFIYGIDISIVGRYVRASISYISLLVLIKKSNLSIYEIFNIIIYVLLVHAIIVIITALNPELQNLLLFFNGFNKTIRQFRSSGLTTGFDMAGLLCNVGLSLLLFVDNPLKKHIVTFFELLLFSVACLLTSRMSMVFLLIIMILGFVYSIVIKNKINFYFCLGFLLIILIPIVFIVVFTVFKYSSFYNWLMENYYEYMIRFENLYISYNHTDNLNSSINNNFNFESLSLIELIFGNGQNINQDPGYTKTIFSIGITGLFISIIFYLSNYFQILKKRKFLMINFIMLMLFINCFYIK